MKNNIFKKICIDAGHCDKFTGAGLGSQREEKDTLNLALKVETILKSFGHTVYMTRRDGSCLDARNKDEDLNARPKYANSVKADFFASLHRNSLAGSNATGNEIWVYSKANTTTCNIAKCILDEVNKVYSVANRGVKKGYTGNANLDYAVNRISTMPSTLLELLFISNPNDNKIFNANIDKYAKAIAVGICNGLGCNSEPLVKDEVKPVTPTPTTPVKPQEKRWKVEIYPLFKEDAERLQKLFINARSKPLHSEVIKRDDGTYKLSSFKYVTKQEADEVCQGIRLLTGCQCFVWEC